MMEYYEHKLDPVGVRPEWLDDDEVVPVLWGHGVWSMRGLHTAANRDWKDKLAIRIPADHWAVPALKAGKVPVRGDAWPGGLTPVLAARMIALIGKMRPGFVVDNYKSEVYLEAHSIMEALNPDPIKAALQDKWPALDTDALRETLAKHNLKIVEA